MDVWMYECRDVCMERALAHQESAGARRSAPERAGAHQEAARSLPAIDPQGWNRLGVAAGRTRCTKTFGSPQKSAKPPGRVRMATGPKNQKRLDN